jgi:hypothetical protein
MHKYTRLFKECVKKCKPCVSGSSNGIRLLQVSHPHTPFCNMDLAHHVRCHPLRYVHEMIVCMGLDMLPHTSAFGQGVSAHIQLTILHTKAGEHVNTGDDCFYYWHTYFVRSVNAEKDANIPYTIYIRTTTTYTHI